MASEETPIVSAVDCMEVTTTPMTTLLTTEITDAPVTSEDMMTQLNEAAPSTSNCRRCNNRSH